MDLGFNNGTIKLNSVNNVFYCGQTITGHITFRLIDSERITGLNIQYLGIAKVLWTEIETQKRNGTTFKTKVDYKAQEQYFDNIQCLMGGQGEMELQPGPHSISFEFKIPDTAPSSFRDDKGEILYEIRAYLEFSDITKERGELVRIFEVVAPFDLNKEDPQIRQPTKITFEEEYSCGCTCKPGIFFLEMEAEATGACPGQYLPIELRAKNNAGLEIQYVLLQLLSKKRFRSQHPIAEVSNADEVLASTKTGSILNGVQRKYQLFLQMPDMIAPNLINCSIINVQYFLQVTVKMPGFHSDLVESSPFYIGLKPFSDFGRGPYVHPMAHSLPSGPIPDYTPIPPQHTSNSVQKSEIGFVKSTPATSNQIFGPQPSNYSQYPHPGYNQNKPSYPGYPAPAYPPCNYPFRGPTMNACPHPPTQYPLNGYTINTPRQSSPSAPPL